MKRKIILFLGIIIALILSVFRASAVPAVPWPVEKVQPDGTPIIVYLKGDEKVHWMESEDGYTLMYDSHKTVVYAEQNAEGNMAPSSIMFKGDASFVPLSKNIRKGLRYSRSQVQTLKQIWEIEDRSGIGKAPAQQAAVSVTGNKKALCILAGFSNKTFTKSVSDFEALMNQTGYNVNGAKGSVQDFYKENSYGQMILTVTVVGTYSLPNTTNYYATHEREFAATVVQMADADVDFTEFANASNQLETFHIIYAGYGDEAIDNGEQIWAHKWQLASPLTLDGVRISVYSCSPELRNGSGSTMPAIGVVCHELGHVFGAPDYYDTDYNESGGTYPGTGSWDLMANGSWNGNGTTPAHINMFQKIQYGWVTPIAWTPSLQVTDMPNSAENPVAYTIKANNDGEMYVLENRQKIGFDVGVPGHGLLIYHVHKDALSPTIVRPNTTHPQKVYVVCASVSTAIPNANPSSYGSVNSGGAPFPGTSNKTAFTDTSTPQAFSWATGMGIDKPVANISESNNRISFTFGLCSPVRDLKAENTFDVISLTWTAPLASGITGYSIYRDDTQLTTVTGVAYDDATADPARIHTYCVYAEYAGCSSKPECVEVQPVNLYHPPAENLKLTIVNNNNVKVKWTAPTMKQWITYGDTHTNSYGFSGAFLDMTIAIRWTPDDLAQLAGSQLTKVKFHTGTAQASNSSLYVQVWQGGNETAPGTLLVNKQVLSYSANSYRTFTLPSPVYIDTTQELWIGVRTVQTGSENIYPLVVSSSPATERKGNLLYFANSPHLGWRSFLTAYGLDYNWCLSGYVESKRTLTAYEISRNGVQIQDIASNILTYTDDDPGTGFHDYCVTAVYNSGKSDPLCGNIALNIAVWKGETTAWRTASNWSSGSRPASSTLVYIPKNVPNFPQLTGNKANNVCKEIFFEAGAEIGRQDLLTYDKANVQFDFSTHGLARNRWHLLSVPLEKVYSGDFSFGGYPYTFLRKFTIVTGDKAGWKPILKDNEPLAVGEGFALWLNANDGLTKGYQDAGESIDPLISSENRQYGIKQEGGIIDLPWFENEKQSQAHRTHKYEAGNSIFYPFFAAADHLPLRNRPVSIARGDEAYKMVDNSQIEVPLAFSEDHGRYFALVGNPFMTTIDLDKLYDNNSTIIKPLFRIWNGVELVEYEVGSEGEKYIAPMQAFFVEKADAYNGNDPLRFNIITISK